MRKLFTFVLALMTFVSVNAEEFYLVGDATPIGWDGDLNQRQSTRMKETSSGVYVWTGVLKHGGEGFKIQAGTSSWDDRYTPSSENFAISGSGSDKYQHNGKDWKWNPTNESWEYRGFEQACVYVP